MPAYAENLISPADSDAQNKFKYMDSAGNNGDVVISGMSGRFPESSSIEEFANNLYEGVDMITEDSRRWTPGLHGLPTRSGKLVDLAHFDAAFFSVSPRQAHAMDPQLRLLLQCTYEAILDAGMHPSVLSGRRVGVYVGCSSSESEEAWSRSPEDVTGYALTGCCRAMFANRLSYTFNFKGPSYAVDTACSSSLVAFQAAWKAMKSGEIEAAIVAGSSLTLKPQTAMQFNSLNMLAKDGKCKAFDESGDGYVRSEAVVAVLLQREESARRIYGHVLHILTNTDGNKEEGVTFPSGAVQKELLQEVYKKSGVHPSRVSYVEAHGTGTKAGDPQEVNALTDVFCQGRQDPLLIGSVKSNMGHSEPASGLCSLVKVLIAMQRKEIPKNLHFLSPNPNIQPLLDGRIKVVSENIPWNGKYAAINSFGFGGSNVHLLLRSPDDIRSFHFSGIYPDVKKDFAGIRKIPRLVVASGRTEEAVKFMLEGAQKARDSGLCTLLDQITGTQVASHPFRGYTFIADGEAPAISISQPEAEQRPVWFVFSGMGSQWVGCGRCLLQLQVFASAIERCHLALLPHGIDLKKIITSDDPQDISSTTASFCAIAAVQVGLVDVVHAAGITAVSGLVGHSVGELGCAYADGALTAEQTVLSAYWRGHAVQEANLPLGAMAAVGLSPEEARQWCGNGPIVVACENASNSVTISGPKEEVEKLQEKLVAKEIFCRSVRSEGIAFHHPTLRKAAPRLKAELQKVIYKPRARSARWVSSSVPEDGWSDDLSVFVSADYLVNNLVSPVLFARALGKIPPNALLIEISPHGLMQAILRRALPQAISIPLVRKDSKDPLMHLLEALGKIYVNGTTMSPSGLFPDSHFPVLPSTPSLSSLIRWDDAIEWDVASFKTSPSSSEFEVTVDLDVEEFKFLEGHTIDGRIIFPATGYMVLAWRALCQLHGVKWDTSSVTFSDITLHQATVFSSSPGSQKITFTVRILLAKGEFEVTVGDAVAASGCIHIGLPEKNRERGILKKILNKSRSSLTDNKLPMLKEEIYKELTLRGYHYSGVFQGIVTADIQGSKGYIEWNENWIPFLDTLLQLSLLGSPTRALMLPTRIRKVIIDTQALFESLVQDGDKKALMACHSQKLGVTLCVGVEIYGLKATLAPRRPVPDTPLLEEYQFIPFHVAADMEISNLLTDENAIRLFVDLIVENTNSRKLKIVQSPLQAPTVGSANKDIDSSHLPLMICKSLEMHPLLQLDYTVLTEQNQNVLSEESKSLLTSSGIIFKEFSETSVLSSLQLLVLSSDNFNKPNLTSKIEGMLKHLENSAFVLTMCKIAPAVLKNNGFVDIATVEKFGLKLFRKPAELKEMDVLDVSNSDSDFSWVEMLKAKLSAGEDRKLCVVSNDPLSGVIGMVKCLRQEPNGQNLRCFYYPTKDSAAAELSTTDLVAADLCVNVCKDGIWGSLRHCLLPPLKPQPTCNALLNVATRGDLSSLTWFTATDSNNLDGRKHCFVHYAPLNFRDIMLASGKLPPDALPGKLAQKDCILGLEFSGINENGRRVMGLVEAGGLATQVHSDPLLTWEIPSSWSLKDAATVPVVYSTAYYALIVRGHLHRGESVLIHSGSGGVGQAAISIALARGCTVYTTVSSDQKKAFLQQRFPELKDANFANSRDASFEYAILEQTEGRGVDVVLNSLAGDLLQASVRCLAEHGRFLEIGKADLANNTALGMAVFLKNIAFHGILLDALFCGSEEERKTLQKLVAEGMTNGEVIPLPHTIFRWDEAEDAFRFMAGGKHIGKVVLEIQPEVTQTSDAVGMTNFIAVPTIPAIPRVQISSELVYVITGGLGGLGLELADWLIGRGAQKIVLTSRRGVSTSYQRLCMTRWKSKGVTVRVLTQDASTVDGAKALLNESAREGSVGGIFHLAVVLQDSLLENQTPEKFSVVCKVKADGAVALDIASRALCPKLHLWVVFSSVACGRGNAGQSNYAWANNVCEHVAESRAAVGFPGIAIQWGGIGDVGILATTLGNIEVGGTRPQSVRSVLECMDILLGSGIPVVSSLCLATKNAAGGQKQGGHSLVRAVANILGVKDVSKIPKNVTLGDLGLDSLMSVEVKQTLEREADLVLTSAQVRDITLNYLQEIEDGKGISQEKTSEGPSASESSEVAPKAFNNLEFFSPEVPKQVVVTLHDSNSDNLPLFLVCPIQGNAMPLMLMAQHLNRKVFALQFSKDLPYGSVLELATALLQEVAQIHTEGHFILGGYSFGACVAFEMAEQLETAGKRLPSLILLDGCHSYVAGVIDKYKTKFASANKNELSQQLDDTVLEEAEALVIFALQMCDVDASELRNILITLPSWDDRLSHTAQLVSQNRIKSGLRVPQADEIMTAADLFFQRLKAGFYHDSSSSHITSPTLLLRASDNPHAVKFGEDYGLREVLKGSLEVDVIAGTHETFLMGESGKSIADLVESFIKKNLN